MLVPISGARLGGDLMFGHTMKLSMSVVAGMLCILGTSCDPLVCYERSASIAAIPTGEEVASAINREMPFAQAEVRLAKSSASWSLGSGLERTRDNEIVEVRKVDLDQVGRPAIGGSLILGGPDGESAITFSSGWRGFRFPTEELNVVRRFSDDLFDLLARHWELSKTTEKFPPGQR